MNKMLTNFFRNADVQFTLGIVGLIAGCFASPYLIDFGLLALKHHSASASGGMCVVLVILSGSILIH